MSIMRECEKLKNWRGHWIDSFKNYNLNVYNSLMQITRHRRDGEHVEIAKNYQWSYGGISSNLFQDNFLILSYW